jgi:hypothetical protein
MVTVEFIVLFKPAITDDRETKPLNDRHRETMEVTKMARTWLHTRVRNVRPITQSVRIQEVSPCR